MRKNKLKIAQNRIGEYPGSLGRPALPGVGEPRAVQPRAATAKPSAAASKSPRKSAGPAAQATRRQDADSARRRTPTQARAGESAKGRSGAAGGMQGTARLLGQSIGSVMMTVLFTLISADTAPRVGLAVGAVLALVAGITSTLRVERAEQIAGG